MVRLEFYFPQSLPLEALYKMFISFCQKGMLFARLKMVLEETKKEIKTVVASLVLYIDIESNFLICWQVEILNLEKE